MLSSLIIKNFVIIDDLELDFEPGANVITGETGAGKSLIIGAILQVSGARMDQSLVRKGCEKAIIEAQFIVSDTSLKGEYDLDQNGSGEIILSRELHSSGKSLAKINGRMVSNQILKNVASELISVFGQNDKIKLFEAGEQLRILDSFVLPKNKTIAEDLSRIVRQYKDLKQKKEELEFSDETAIERERELIEYQINDIDAAELIPEDETLEDRYEKMKNAHNIIEHLQISKDLIDGEERASILHSLQTLTKTMDFIAAYDKEYLAWIEKLEDIKYEFIDMKHSIDAQLDTLEIHPSELYELENRLDLINSLKKKYGANLQEIQRYREELDQRLEKIDSYSDLRESIDRDLEELRIAYFEKAKLLSALRKKKAKEISKEISENLKELNFKSALFEIRFEESDRIENEGIDKIEFMVKINSGSDFAPLRKVASGGEMSRIVLAIQESIAHEYKIPVLIFDEIDTGISGKAANALAKKLYAVSRTHQLLIVSHLLQVVLYGDQHYLIEKEESEERTSTKFRKLDFESRVDEVYRLIRSDSDSRELREEARKMLETVQESKKDFKKALS